MIILLYSSSNTLLSAELAIRKLGLAKPDIVIGAKNKSALSGSFFERCRALHFEQGMLSGTLILLWIFLQSLLCKGKVTILQPRPYWYLTLLVAAPSSYSNDKKTGNMRSRLKRLIMKKAPPSFLGRVKTIYYGDGFSVNCMNDGQDGAIVLPSAKNRYVAYHVPQINELDFDSPFATRIESELVLDMMSRFSAKAPTANYKGYTSNVALLMILPNFKMNNRVRCSDVEDLLIEYISTLPDYRRIYVKFHPNCFDFKFNIEYSNSSIKILERSAPIELLMSDILLRYNNLHAVGLSKGGLNTCNLANVKVVGTGFGRRLVQKYYNESEVNKRIKLELELSQKLRN